MDTVFAFDADGYLTGEVPAIQNPKRPAELLVPERCTHVAPPDMAEGQRARWNGSQWVVEQQMAVGLVSAPSQKSSGKKSRSFAALRGEMARRWGAMKVDPKRAGEIDRVAQKLLAAKARYVAVAQDTGVPWALIAVLHYRESSGDFSGVLHNGEKILGTGRKTRIEPKGRGPFSTWREAAVDALSIKGLRPGLEWSVERCLYEGERFNGFGYRANGCVSAYVWAATDQYQGGKYVADHVFNRSVWDKQLGIAAIMARLAALDESVSFDTPEAGGEEVEPSGDEIDVDDGLSRGEIAALQRRLRDLGYSEVGFVDGRWGPRTVAAIAAFQATSGLPVNVSADRVDLDRATAAALATAGRRPVDGARSSVTAKELRKAGDKLVKSTWWSKISAFFLGIPALFAGVAKEMPGATEKLDPFSDLLGSIPGWVWPAAVVVVAVGIYAAAQRAETVAVDDVRSGRDAGPV